MFQGLGRLYIGTEDPINCSPAERHGAIWQPISFQQTRIIRSHAPRCTVNASLATESASDRSAICY